MAVRLRVIRVDGSVDRDALFDQDVISIGRETGSTLTLSGTLVSKRHARIEGYDQTYRVVDLRSTNSTFLNDERLIAEKPYALHIGDRIRIGDHIVEVVGFDRRAGGQADKQAAGASPTDLGVRSASSPLPAAVPTSARENEHDAKPAADISALSARVEGLEKECEWLRGENRRLENQLLAQKQVHAGSFTSAAVAGSSSVSLERVAPLLRGFLRAFSRLVRGRSSFRNEFLGTTIITDNELSPVLSGSAEKGVEFLLDPAASDEEAKARNAAMQRALDDLILHFMGLLEGYRSGIDEGVQKLLQKSDPETFRAQVAGASITLGPVKIPYRFIPMAVEWKVLQMMRRAHEELLQEDRGVLEKRYFRPFFIRGYEKCIASLRGTITAQHETNE